MNAIRKIRVEDVIAFSAIAMIAFHLYWQYWFVDLMGVWVVNPLLPIAILGILALIYIRSTGSWPEFDVALPATWAFLGLYLLFASASSLVNETDFRQVINWLVYAWSPAAVFLTIHGLKNLRDDDQINRCVKFLFLVMVLLSIYGLYALNFQRYPILKPILYWGEHGVVFETRGSDPLRYSLPGMSSTHYAPMLLPLILLGVHWAHESERVAKYVFLAATGFLAYCLFGTIARAAIIPLLVGLAYLTWVRCIPRWSGALVGCSVIGLCFLHPAIAMRLTALTPALDYPERQMLAHIVRDPESATQIVGSTPTTQGHLVIAAHTLGIAARRPILGVGMGRLGDLQNSTLAEYGGKSHNNFLSIAAGFGFPALLFYSLFLISLAVYLNRAIDRMPDSEARRLGQTWLAILISYGLYLNGEPAEFHFVWLWLALIAVWIRNHKDAHASVV